MLVLGEGREETQNCELTTHNRTTTRLPAIGQSHHHGRNRQRQNHRQVPPLGSAWRIPRLSALPPTRSRKTAPKILRSGSQGNHQQPQPAARHKARAQRRTQSGQIRPLRTGSDSPGRNRQRQNHRHLPSSGYGRRTARLQALPQNVSSKGTTEARLSNAPLSRKKRNRQSRSQTHKSRSDSDSRKQRASSAKKTSSSACTETCSTTSTHTPAPAKTDSTTARATCAQAKTSNSSPREAL